MKKIILPEDIGVSKELEENTIEYQLKYADEKYALGEYEGALISYRKVIDLGGKYPDVYNKIGIILNQLGRLYEAVEAFKDALRLNPRYLDAIVNLGIVYSDLGDEVNAIIEFKKALEIDPNNSEALFNLRLVTREDIKGLAQPSNTVEILIDMGKSFYEKGMYRQAIDKFKEVLNEKPNYYDVALLLANSYLKDGFYKDAERLYKNIIIKKPDWSIVYANLGTLYYNVKKYKTAIGYWEKAIKNGGETEELKNCIKLANDKMKGLKPKGV